MEDDRGMDHFEWVNRYIEGKGETKHFENRHSVVFSHEALPKGIVLKQSASGDSQNIGIDDSVGCAIISVRLWAMGHRMATYLCENPALVAGVEVLDLGSGVGISGLTAAALGAHSVTLTDAHVELLIENARQSELQNVLVEQLIWGETELENESPALIIASDIIYNQGKEVMDQLVKTLSYFARKTKGKGLKFLLAYQARNDWESLKAFREGVKTEGFEVVAIPTPEWDDDQMLLECSFPAETLI